MLAPVSLSSLGSSSAASFRASSGAAAPASIPFPICSKVSSLKRSTAVRKSLSAVSVLMKRTMASFS